MVDPEVTSIHPSTSHQKLGVSELAAPQAGGWFGGQFSWAWTQRGNGKSPRAWENDWNKFRYLKCCFFLRCTQLVGLFWNKRNVYIYIYICTCLNCKYRYLYRYMIYIIYIYTHLLFKQKNGVRQTTHSLKSLEKKEKKKTTLPWFFAAPTATPLGLPNAGCFHHASLIHGATPSAKVTFQRRLRWFAIFCGPGNTKHLGTYEQRTWKLKF